MGIKLFDYQYSDDSELGGMIIEHIYEQFERVEQPKAGELILFGTKTDIPDHIGVYLGKNRFIHSIRGHGVIVSKLGVWKGKAYGYYRAKNADKDSSQRT